MESDIVENEKNSMEELLKDYDVKRISTGEIITGKVIDVTDKEVTVNIDYAFDGVITRDELTYDDQNPHDVVKAGDSIEVYVISPNDGEGYVLLSRIKALAITEKDDVQEAFDNKTTIKVLLKEIVKGGVVAYYGNVRIFIPASQISKHRVELETLKMNTYMDVKIIELNFKDRKIVGSRRVIEEEEYENNRRDIYKSLNPGEKRKGIVTRLAKFGAFVDIGGVEGLIHLNDMAWERVFKPEDVVQVGDTVEVFIGEVDEKNNRISLILKDNEKDPWIVYADSLKEGEIVEGKVVRTTNFGAFVEIYNRIEGLVHITEISDDNIAKVTDVVNVSDIVKVKILSVDKENRKLSLSIKEAIEPNNEYMQYNDNEDEAGTSLADLFKGLKL